MNLFPQVQTKLCLIIVVPDEALKHTQIMVARIRYFTFFDMDVIIFPHAQGFLAYNNIEQQITSLSSKLTLEIILPFDIFRCHLNSHNQRVDEDLEKQHYLQATKFLLRYGMMALSNCKLHRSVRAAKTADCDRKSWKVDSKTSESLNI